MNEKRVDLESLGIYSDERVIEMAGLTEKDIEGIGRRAVVSTLRALKEYDSAVSFLEEYGEPHNVHPDKPNMIAKSLGEELIYGMRLIVRGKKEEKKKSPKE